MKKIGQAMLNKIIYIGEEIPFGVSNDKRPKFVILGTPQELIDECSPDEQAEKAEPAYFTGCAPCGTEKCKHDKSPEIPNMPKRHCEKRNCGICENRELIVDIIRYLKAKE